MSIRDWFNWHFAQRGVSAAESEAHMNPSLRAYFQKMPQMVLKTLPVKSDTIGWFWVNQVVCLYPHMDLELQSVPPVVWTFAHGEWCACCTFVIYSLVQTSTRPLSLAHTALKLLDTCLLFILPFYKRQLLPLVFDVTVGTLPQRLDHIATIITLATVQGKKRP